MFTSCTLSFFFLSFRKVSRVVLDFVSSYYLWSIIIFRRLLTYFYPRWHELVLWAQSCEVCLLVDLDLILLNLMCFYRSGLNDEQEILDLTTETGPKYVGLIGDLLRRTLNNVQWVSDLRRYADFCREISCSSFFAHIAFRLTTYWMSSS